MINKKTWYAHMFRTQGGDFGFPYPISGRDQKKAQDYAVKYVAIQKDEFKRLGVFGDWDNPYLTIDHSYEEKIITLTVTPVWSGQDQIDFSITGQSTSNAGVVTTHAGVLTRRSNNVYLPLVVRGG